MPDTKIRKEAAGWIDCDNPNTYYRVRRLVRDARRKNRLANGNYTPKNQTTITDSSLAAKKVTTNVVVTGVSSKPNLTYLQNRLLSRLTGYQNVSYDDAISIITNNGYNKAASYGHMRAAGATHDEALLVVGFNDPELSLEYGKNRANGLNHADAFFQAQVAVDWMRIIFL